LGAYHDVGKTGISDEIALRLIQMIEPHGKVYITSERPLPPQFEPYRISIRAADIHHALYFAEMFIGDSQTMTAESAVLGTPALRFNDFVGELSYLEDLEHNYGLTYGIKTNELEKLYQKLDELLNTPNLKLEWEKKRSYMLTKKSNFAKWMIHFFQNYPTSIKSKN
jgi:predicted glycosyltransferase